MQVRSGSFLNTTNPGKGRMGGVCVDNQSVQSCRLSTHPNPSLIIEKGKRMQVHSGSVMKSLEKRRRRIEIRMLMEAPAPPLFTCREGQAGLRPDGVSSLTSGKKTDTSFRGDGNTNTDL